MTVISTRNGTETTIDAGALLRDLISRRNTAGLFRLDMPEDIMYRILVSYCREDVQKRHREFSLTDEFAAHLTQVAKWLTGDSPTFGLFLCGGVGNGKSTVLRALCNIAAWWANSWYDSLMLSAKDVVRYARAYANPNDMNYLDAERYQHAKDVKVLAVDDMGEEPQSVLSYGDTLMPMSDLISERYNRVLTTLVSTNMAATEIRKYYGERIADRLREMMTIVDFGDEPSFRAGNVVCPVKQKRAETQRSK